MAQFRDGITELVEGEALGKTVDNVLVMPSHNGAADLVLTHTLEESGGIVRKALIVGKWHFNSAEDLQAFANMLVKSIRKAQRLTDDEIDTTRAEFLNVLKKVSKKS